jgi:photosystem II stability/assembly factor-like uncharacterized protein
LASSSSSGTPVPTFTSIGPPGGYISALEFHPTLTNVILAGADDSGGLFVSSDSGVSWAPVPLGRNNWSAWHVTVGPELNVITLVDAYGHGVLRSQDGGLTWQERNNGLTMQNPDRIIKALAVDPVTSQTMYVGTLAGVARTTNGGLNWSYLTAFPGTGAVQKLLVTNTNPKRLFAMVAGGEIFRSVDDGVSWTLVADIPQTNGPGEESWELTAAPGNPDHMLASCADRMVRSTDGGLTWQAFNPTEFNGTHATIGITAGFAPNDPLTIYVGAFRVFGGVNLRLKTINGGTSFTDITPPRATRVFRIRVSPHDANRVLLATAGDGLELSTNGGATWTQHVTGPRVGTAPGDFALAPSNANRIYLRGGMDLHRTDNGGTSWTTLAMPTAFTFQLAVHPTNQDTLLEAPVFLIENGVNRSTNGGASWTHVDLNGHSVMCLLWDPLNPNNVFACGFGYGLTTPRHGVYASTNGGASFGVNPITPVSWEATVVPSALAFHPTVAGALVVATVGGLFVSDATRTTYNFVSAIPGNPNLQSLAVSPTTWVAGGENVIWSSPDNGVTWRSVNIPDVNVQGVALDPNVPGRILAAVNAIDRDFSSESVPGLYVSNDAGLTFVRVSGSLVPADQAWRIKPIPGQAAFLMEMYASSGDLMRVTFP